MKGHAIEYFIFWLCQACYKSVVLLCFTLIIIYYYIHLLSSFFLFIYIADSFCLFTSIS